MRAEPTRVLATARRTGRRACCSERLERPGEVAPVVQAGERVADRLLRELGPQRLQLGHVPQHEHEPDRAPARVAEVGDAYVHRPRATGQRHRALPRLQARHPREGRSDLVERGAEQGTGACAAAASSAHTAGL